MFNSDQSTTFINVSERSTLSYYAELKGHEVSDRVYLGSDLGVENFEFFGVTQKDEALVPVNGVLGLAAQSWGNGPLYLE